MCLFEDKVKDHCGVVGVYAPGTENIGRTVYFGLHALQHRGQESAGILVNKKGEFQYYKDVGLVHEVFTDSIMNRLQGDIAIGHVRYSTAGSAGKNNAMPIVNYHEKTPISIAHNGNLTNYIPLRDQLQRAGYSFHTDIDSEVISVLATKYMKEYDLEDALEKAMSQVRGAYALVLTSGEKLIAARDPYGIRPLCIGTDGEKFVVSSESCIFSLIGVEFLRNVRPGEMITIEDGELKSRFFAEEHKAGVCAFEYVYFSRPDSYIDGKNVHSLRNNCGRELANVMPVEADMVIAVPDSGTVSAIGYAKEAGIPFGEGLIKNRYVGRTFIQPDQKTRELSVRLKLNVLRENIKGKRIVMVDDSIVRGTTSAKIVNMLRDAGATEVHIRVASPPVKSPCFFGIDTPDKDKLVAANYTIEEMRDQIGADSLAFLPVDAMKRALLDSEDSLCKGCFTGCYPFEI